MEEALQPDASASDPHASVRRRSRSFLRLLGAVLACAVLAGAAIAPAAASGAGVIPSLQITYTGSMLIETHSGGSLAKRTASWTASSIYNGETLEGGERLTFSSLAGSYEYHSGKPWKCYESYLPELTEELQPTLRAEENPLNVRWLLEAIPPDTYEVTKVPLLLPDWWVGTFNKGSACEIASYETPFEHGLRNWTFISHCPLSTPSEQAEYKEMIETPAVIKAGTPAAYTTTITQSCDEGETETTATLTSTVSAGNPLANNEKPPPTPQPAPQAPPTQQQAEAGREQMKRQGKADLVKAVEAAEANIGLTTLLQLAGNKLLSDVVDEIAGPSARFQGKSAVNRVINDFRIVKDPPDPAFTDLAEPGTARARSASSCRRYRGRKGTYCKELAAAEAKLSSSCSQVAATTGSLETTISRDTAALQAHQLAAAGEQASHFEALEAQLRSTLAGEGKAGAAVAALLRRAGVKGRLDEQQAKRALKTLEQRAAARGVPTSSLASAAGPAALKPSPLDAFAALGR